MVAERRLGWVSSTLVPATLAALLSAATLIPSESAVSEGSHVVIVMAWLLLLATWLTHCLLQGGWKSSPGPTDVAVLILLAWMTISGIVMIGSGHGRPTLNALSLWWTYGAIYFTARQYLRRSSAIRETVACILALAVGLSAMAFYQYVYSMPALRAEFAANPDAALHQAGISAPAQSAVRQQFINRLESSEPMGPFALTNSLAGFLVPGIVLAGVMLFESMRRVSDRWPHRLSLACLAAVVCICLLLTKSRAAVLASMFALLALGALRVTWNKRLAWILAGATAAIALLGAIAFFWAGWDRQVITEAPKSLLYRLEYWQSTFEMIQDYPWFGCGPGNFKEYYTTYKLPAASETVSDPHNWVLEIAATGGLPACLALIGIGWCHCRQTLGLRRAQPAPAVSVDSEETQDNRPASESVHQDDSASSVEHIRPGALISGCLCGMLVAFPTGWSGGMAPDTALLWTCLPAAALTVRCLWPWVRTGKLPRHGPLLALAALIVNLSASGGLMFPGVGQLAWLLLAVSLNPQKEHASTRTATTARRIGTRRSMAFATGTAVIVAATAYLTVYRPQLIARGYLADASDPRRWRDLETLFRDAATADPWWSEPCEYLAQLGVQQFAQFGGQESLELLRDGARQALDRNPRSSLLAQQTGDWMISIYDRGADPEWLFQAVAAYERAVTNYPNNGFLHAQLAWAYHLQGRSDRALEQADLALRLDRLMPHEEFKLARQTLQGGQAGGDPEQRMQFLRNIIDNK